MIRNNLFSRCWLTLAILTVAWVSRGHNSQADTTKIPLPPVEDLAFQIQVTIGQLGKDLKQAEDYDEDKATQVEQKANMLAVLALTLGKHDQDHLLQKATPELIETARILAAAAPEFEGAQVALNQIQKALQATGNAKELEWKPVADIAVLMQQVPIVNNRLRRGVNSRRFAKSIEKNAALSAALVAMAQASQLDTSYCDGEQQEIEWQKICADMGSAAMEVNHAIRKKDQAAAKLGLNRIVKTCDACHHSFRD